MPRNTSGAALIHSFDILDPNTPLFGAKILEASAGTGKTFAIEHLVVRLLLECDIEIEEILAITYTRAAAREMRLRIRQNLQAALLALSSNECLWPYLAKHLGSKKSIRRLEGALFGFENGQIFTIHGFCQRMLSEFSLEAKCLQPRAEDAAPLGKALRGDILDFLERQRVLEPEQMQELFRKKDLSRLAKDLLNHPLVPFEEPFSIEETMKECPFADVKDEFGKIEPFCKYSGFNRLGLAAELDALEELFSDRTSKKAIRSLLRWKGDLFRFTSASNRKKGKEDIPQPPLFEWCERHLMPLLEKALDPKRLFQKLRFAWQKPYEKLLEERGLFSPDFLLEQMRRSIAYPNFVAKIQRRTKAAIIDEFQDTDAVQWEIFSTLFQHLPFFYLVGDPKQSIYRFRNADLYTYYRARASLGSDAAYSLDTNYRSSPELVDALNELFGERHVEPWLWLPSDKRTESYRPVKAGLSQSWDPGDGLKPLQFVRLETLKDEAFSFIANEIRRLRPHLSGYSSFAILVQSNDQAALIQDYLQKFSFPCIAKSRSSLGTSLAKETLEDLFNALFFPRNPSFLKLFLAGPLMANPFDPIGDLSHLFSWKNTLEERGMASFFREFLRGRWEGPCSFYEKIAACGTSFFRDFFQLVEMLLSKNPKSPEAISRVFREIEEADPDEDAMARRKMDEGEDAIQILTMHASKGLEFEVVFALGATAPTLPSPEDLEETEAEKLRQLYVALTRAKKRLYIPLVPVKSKEGGEPPLELLWRRSKLGSVEKLIDLNPHIGLIEAKGESASWIPETEESVSLSSSKPFSFPRPPGMVYSYSALAKQQQQGEKLAPPGSEKAIQNLPRGAEVGILFHRIFEKIFTEKTTPREIVQEELLFSELSGWEEVVWDAVDKALSMPLLDGATLLDIDRSQVKAEVEFFFHAPPHFFKGCIDLLFVWKERLYFLDWKTNWLEDYSEETLRRAMDEHNYWMQASLYAEAIRRACPNMPFGKAIYLFIRGGVLSFEPSAWV